MPSFVLLNQNTTCIYVCRCEIVFYRVLYIPYSVPTGADPGFPTGGGILSAGHFLTKTCVKTKELGPIGEPWHSK